MLNIELLLNVLSLQIGLENLELNKQQIQGLNEHLEKQDKVLENEQNDMLRKIIENQEKILELLGGDISA